MKPIGKTEFYGKIDSTLLNGFVSVNEPQFKKKLLDYMQNPNFCSVCTSARVFDYFKNTETDIAMNSYEDNLYYWDDRDIYYLKEYNIEPTNEFIQHVLNQK